VPAAGRGGGVRQVAYRLRKTEFIRESAVRNRYNKKAFFRRHINDNMDALFSFAMRLTQNSADAEDLVAATTSKAWAAIGSLADEASFRSWIFRILHNCYIRDYRKERVDLEPEAKACTDTYSCASIDWVCIDHKGRRDF
jgi:DNA-directed RNA polymerase specialized sigma24 family protein